MSQLGRFVGLDYIKTVTGDSGGPVGPDTVQNINLVGDGTLITVVGDQGTHALTITGDESIAAQFDTDSGTAIPIANVLNIIGGTGMSTSGASNIVTVTLSVPVDVTNGGTGATSLTNHGVLLGSGVSAVTVTTVGTNGQVLLGATMADPAFGTLTSADNSIVYATGANALDLTVDIAAAGGVDGLIPDSGTSPVVPNASGDITIVGGTNIGTVGGTNTLTVNLDAAITLATSVTSPLYTTPVTTDLILNMVDDAGTYSVSFTNNSDVEVAYINSLGAALFTQLDVDNININGNTIISTNTNGNINLTPNGSGLVTVGYLTQYYVPIIGASGALRNLADGLGTAGQILTSNGAGAEPSWEDAAGLSWTVATGSTQAMSVSKGYFANYNGTLAFTLPTTAAVGATMQIAQMFSGQGWSLAQNSGQKCYIGNTSTTTTTGTLASTANGDWIEIICRVANTDFQVNVKSGNITVT